MNDPHWVQSVKNLTNGFICCQISADQLLPGAISLGIFHSRVGLHSRSWALCWKLLTFHWEALPAAAAAALHGLNIYTKERCLFNPTFVLFCVFEVVAISRLGRVCKARLEHLSKAYWSGDFHRISTASQFRMRCWVLAFLATTLWLQLALFRDVTAKKERKRQKEPSQYTEPYNATLSNSEEVSGSTKVCIGTFLVISYACCMKLSGSLISVQGVNNGLYGFIRTSPITCQNKHSNTEYSKCVYCGAQI